MKKLLEYILVIVLLSPLLFINIRDSHDWGDDFAGYVRQAKNIAEGKPFYQSKFEYHEYNPVYAPPYYSYGFPLLLSPIIKIYGLNFKAMDRYVSLWMMAWALLVFAYLRRYFSFFPSVAFILIFFLNPFFFEFKTYIISDIPFAFFFLLAVMLYQWRSGRAIYYLALTGLVIAFLIGIRGMGFILLPIILIDWACRFLSSDENLKTGIRESGIILMSALLFTGLSSLIFKGPADLLGHFISLFISRHYWDVVLHSLDVYTNEFLNMFWHNTGKYSFSVNYTKAFMLTLLVIGFVNSIFSWYRFELLVVLVFGGTILLFPFSTQGFRYMLPLLPIFIVYIIIGAKSIRIEGFNRTFIAICFIVFILLQYKKDIRSMRDDQVNPVWPGPQTGYNQKALIYIKTAIPDYAMIACLKPRAIELMTDKRTCVLPYGNDIPEISTKLNEAHPAYLLSLKDLGSKIDDVAAYRKDSMIWENAACRLYLCKKENTNR